MSDRYIFIVGFYAFLAIADAVGSGATAASRISSRKASSRICRVTA